MEKEDTSFDIHKYIALLLRRKWLWIIPTVIFGIGAIIHVTNLPDVYESKCILIPERSGGLDRVLRAESRVNTSNIRERMLGWQPVMQLIRTLDLDKDIPQYDQGALEKLYNSIVGKVKVNSQRRSNLIAVSYRGKNPENTFRIVDGLVANFVESSLKSSRTEASETVEFIDKDLVRLKRDLDKSDKQLRLFEEKHVNEIPGSEGAKVLKLSAAENALAEVNRTIADLQERITFLDDYLDKEGKTMTGEIVRIPNPKVDALKERIMDLEIDLTTMRAKYYDGYPGIITGESELAELKKILENESEKVVSEEKIVNNPMYDNIKEKGFTEQLELKAFQRLRKEIESSITFLKKSIKTIPELKQKYSELQLEHSMNKDLFAQRLGQKSKAELMKTRSLDATAERFIIMEAPRISYKPIKSVKIKAFGTIVIMGLGLGIGLIFGLEKIDQRFKTMEDVQDYLNLPALGMIPTILTKTEVKRKVKKRIIVYSSTAALIIVTAAVCLIIEPVRTVVSDNASAGWGELVKIIRK
jgi:polysaccharide chain length determinant protein (PEP-CTERM system associated)